jgi:hypothetical protein
MVAAVVATSLVTATTAIAQVATVAALTGTAQATPAAGAARTLRMGDGVNQGDTVTTGANSSVVLRFEDGQVAALTANSRLAITTYTYNRAEPAKSNMLLSLAQGGLRAVTGLIGKAKPENVAYRAGNATIGVRGTDLEIGVADKDLFVLANAGEADVDLPTEGDVKTGALPMSGNPFAISLPIATASLPQELQHLAQPIRKVSSFRVNIQNGMISVNGIGRTARPSEIRFLARQVTRLAIMEAQLSGPELTTFVNDVVAAVQRQQAANQSAPTTGRSSITLQAPTAGSSGSGGGGTVQCTSVSPVRSPPNCTPN